MVMQTVPRSRLLGFELYKIQPTPQSTPEQREFGVYLEGGMLSTHLTIESAVAYLAEHFYQQRSPLLQRVCDPEITVTFSIR